MLNPLLRDGMFYTITGDFTNIGTVLVTPKAVAHTADGLVSVSKQKSKWMVDVAYAINCLLQKNGIPTAMIGKNHNGDSIRQHQIMMIPTTIIVRGESRGTYSTHHVATDYGTRFSPTAVEFIFRTRCETVGQSFFAVHPDQLPKYMYAQFIHDHSGKKIDHIVLHHLERPSLASNMCIVDKRAFPTAKKSIEERILEIEMMSRRIFALMQAVFEQIGGNMTDIKIKFGYDRSGELVVADLISLESWRLYIDGKNHGKKIFTEEKDISAVEILNRHRRVAESIEKMGFVDSTLIPAT